MIKLRKFASAFMAIAMLVLCFQAAPVMAEDKRENGKGGIYRLNSNYENVLSDITPHSFNGQQYF